MNKPIVLRTAAIYLRFPEIAKEECEDLAEFLEDNHIVYEGATDVFIEKDKEIERLAKDCDMWNRKYNEQFNIITELEKYIVEEIDDAQEELNIILQGNDLDYKNECTKEFNCIKNALDMLLDKLKELKEGKE